MPIDPSIPLGVKPPQIISPAQLISLKNLQRAGQIQQLQLTEAQRQQQAQGQVRQAFQQPGAIDPTTGMPSSQAISAAMQADPMLGAKLAEQRLTTLAALSQQNQLKIKQATERESLVKDINRAAANAYDQTLKATGGNEQEAMREATRVRNQSADEAWKDGRGPAVGVTPEQYQQFISTPPDIKGIKARYFTQAELDKETAPLSSLAKLKADLKAGRISQAEYDKQALKINAPPMSVVYTSGAGAIPKETLDFVADQYLAGDKSAIAGFSRNPIVRAQMSNAIRERAAVKGYSPERVAAQIAEFEGTKAGERTLGTRTANIEMAVTEAQNVIPLALDASKAVDRTKYPSLNSVILAVKKGTGDPAAARFVAANNALMNIYSRAIAPTGTPTVFDKAHAEDVLSTAYATGQYSAVVDMMRSEMGAARKSPGQVRGAFRESVTGEAPKSEQAKAPQAAIDYLKAHPEDKGQFKAKYGYLPDGQ